MKNVSFSKQLSSSKDDNLSLNLSRLGNDASINLLHSPITKNTNSSPNKIDSVVTNSELMTFKNLFNHSSHMGNIKDYKSSQYTTLAKENFNTSNS